MLRAWSFAAASVLIMVAASVLSVDGGTVAAGGATIGVLHDTERGKLLGRALAKWDSDIKVAKGRNCGVQVRRLRKAGIRRFVNLCQTWMPVAQGKRVTVVTPGVCPPGLLKCKSVRLPEKSQWRSLALVMKQLGLTRVMLGEDVEGDAALKEVMAEEKIEVESLPDVEKLSEMKLAPNETMVIISSSSALAPTLKRYQAAQFLHWFAPDAARSESSALLESTEIQKLLGKARLYTTQTGVSSFATLPTIPAGSSFSDTALAMDAVTLVRGGAPSEGLTGNISVTSDGKRVSGYADVLLWRPNQQVITTAAAAVHADGWVPVASIRNNTLLPPSVHYVLPSRLISTLASPSACDAGLVTINGTDSISGRAYHRRFRALDAPRALLVYGQRPFKVGLQCEGVEAEYRCHTRTHAVNCVRRVRLPGARKPANVGKKSNRARVLSRAARAAEGPIAQENQRTRYLVHRSGRAGHKTEANKVAAGGPPKTFDHYQAVNKASGYNDASSPDVNRAGPLPGSSSALPTSALAAGSSFYQAEIPAPEGYQPNSPNHAVQPYTGRNPSRRQGTFNYAVNNALSSERVDSEILLPVLPDLFACVGSVGGCGFCMAYYSVSDAATPESCIVACSLGIGGTCSAVVGGLIKELAS